MDYQRIHDFICQRAKDQLEERSYNRKNKIQYYESHHIIPKCMGGTGNATNWKHSNIVLLTAKEHYIIHRLLCLIYPNNQDLEIAVWCLINGNGSESRYVISGKIYECYRKKYAEISSNRMKTVIQDGFFTDDIRNKLRENKIGKPGNRRGIKLKVPVSEETKQKLRLARLGKPGSRLGVKSQKPISEETKQKMRLAKLGKRHSEETKQKMRLARFKNRNKV